MISFTKCDGESVKGNELRMLARRYVYIMYNRCGL